MAAARRRHKTTATATADTVYTSLLAMATKEDICNEALHVLGSDVLHEPFEYLKFKTYLDRFLFRTRADVCKTCDLASMFSAADLTTQVQVLREVNAQVHRFGKWRHPVWHILTDVDDTLYAHRAGGIAGTDYSWFEKRQYPGVAALFQAINARNPKHLRYVTVLSATPLVLKTPRLDSDDIRSAIGAQYSFLHGKDSIWDVVTDFAKGSAASVANVLRGTRSVHTPLSVDTLSVARTKIDRFKTYKALFPEFRFCFFGDNGQGDVLAGLYMLETTPNALVCIHNILKRNADGSFSRATSAAEAEAFYAHHERTEGLADIRARLIFFNTYAQLATELCLRHHILPEDRTRVLDETAATKVAHCRTRGYEGETADDVLSRCREKHPTFFYDEP